MKKLLLILSAVFVSVMAWAGLNPYAYGLKSYLNDDKSELTMIYTLNADAEKSHENNPTAIGVQVYIFEKASGNIVKTLTNGSITQGTCTLTVATVDLPKDVPLSWKVVVHGNAKQTKPAVVHDRVANNRPNATHGVAIDKNPESPNFGNIYYTEASSGNLNATWDWMERYTRPCIWQYSPQLTYQGHFYKDKENNVDVANFITTSQTEPHRIRISDDNRIFVSSCYENATTVVWEYKGGNNFNRVITRTSTYGKVVGMDVFGSGNNLKILLCYMSGNTLTFREYALGSAGSISGSGIDKGTYTEKTLVISDTHVGVAYDDNGESFWFAIDRSEGYSSRVIHMKKSGSSYVCGAVNKCPLVTGGDGLFVKGNLLVKGIAYSGAGRLYFFKIDGDKIMNDAGTASLQYYDNCEYIDVFTYNWVNGMDMDYAGNLYIASAFAGNAIAISMPYDGRRETKARDIYTFTLPKPVPNIYATNLRYEAVEGAPKYKFSFNVNTQPKYAEIRFYKSYESMKKSMLAVNADDFKGGKTTRDNDLYCYYPISGLKQGKIEVEFGMVGGIINQQTKELTNARLPRGELYWSVYVETDKSAAFAPIYRQPLTGADAHYHMHAIVNDNPETDQFGTIYGAQEDKRVDSTNKRSSLMIYEISDNGSDVHDLNNTTRYVKKQEYWYNTSDAAYNAKPRRMDIAPDGTIYIAHEGKDNQKSADTVAVWQYGGIYAWNPNDPIVNGKLKLSKFSNNKIGTSSAVALYGHVNGNDTTWKMYAANSYGEFSTHIGGGYYSAENQRGIFGWNGFVEYEKDDATNWHEYQLKQGDASGNSSLVAMDKGVWICQHREHNIDVKVKMAQAFPDNRGALILSFVPYGNYTNAANWGPRTWRSSTTDGGRTVDENGILTTTNEVKSELTQKDGAILQATPGAGMAYRKINGVDYLFINNHDGNIVQLQVDWKANTNPATPEVHVSKAKVLTTPAGVKGILTVNGDTQKNIRWKTAAVSSMCFDFAGNLVTTTGNSYLKLDVAQLLNNAGDQDAFNTPEGGQSIIIYTMPYDRTNAREIQAPKSNIFIPERFAQLNMTTDDIQDVLEEHKGHNSECYVDLYRPLQGGMFNTICLPFQLITTEIPHDHPLYEAEFMRFTGVELNDNLGGEKILTLVFADLENNTMAPNVPHIVKPKSNIKSIIPFDWVQELAKNTAVESPYFNFDNGNRITYQGILPKTQVDALYDPNTNLPLRLILVADNRLAVLTGNGEMYGFRGYFDLAQPLPPGTVAKISAKKDTPTNTTIVVDGKKVNIDKYLREGRVYIRVGDSLYTIDGQVVE